ncbi:MAG: hypothetical protein QXY50_05255 [Candidatus Caldarchaeum sp.]
MAATIGLFAWVFARETFPNQKVYEVLVRKGVEHQVAVYYDRKIIHILAGVLWLLWCHTCSTTSCL